LAYFLAAVSATIAVPAFHNWLPGTWLSVKGAVWGLLASGLAAWSFSLPGLPLAALILSATSASAYLALNFTGATTYTPVNGVKREMRRVLPAIISAGGLGLAGWVTIVIRRIVA
jgi:acetyl-CoA decarbonylase/synthase complex subunit gamma